jgi:DNA-binding response OmpR family regulator
MNKRRFMPAKILIVDDEDYIRLLLEQTLEELEDEGVELLTAKNGAEALEIIKREKPQLVFLDVMMPIMNGYEVCRTVKYDLKLTEVFIILLTARSQGYAREKGQEVGADIYMTKPFAPNEILKRATEVLSSKTSN